MAQPPQAFLGRGNRTFVEEVTKRLPAEWVPFEDSDGERRAASMDHPEGYIAHEDVAAAVNTALLLGKPLLLSGNPGTGKTQLADRIAWEYSLGAVLRFEAQSISEAQDLFYRFDLVGRMAHANLRGSGESSTPAPDARDFISFGPLGKAILRASPPPPGAGRPDDPRGRRVALLERAFFSENRGNWEPRRSVVLIDEIDKASRDFPNDLLNAIERLEFRIRELPKEEGTSVRVSGDVSLRPIVVITSNGEREIPAPFLRRCVFCHIPDPDLPTLRRIIKNRVLSSPESPAGDGEETTPKLPPLYEQLLGLFEQFRKDDQSFAYRPGPAELVDWSRAIDRSGDAKPTAGLAANRELALRTSSAVAKNQQDRERLLDLFKEIQLPSPKTAPS